MRHSKFEATHVVKSTGRRCVLEDTYKCMQVFGRRLVVNYDKGIIENLVRYEDGTYEIVNFEDTNYLG